MVHSTDQIDPRFKILSSTIIDSADSGYSGPDLPNYGRSSSYSFGPQIVHIYFLQY